MPSNEIKGAVILLYRDQLTIRFIDNVPVDMQLIINSSNWEKEVTRIRQTMATKRAQIWQLPHRTPNFGYVATSYLGVWRQVQAESDASLDYADLARLQEDHAHFSLDIKVAQLCADQEVAICVAESSPFHAGIDHIDVKSDTFPDVRVTTTREGVQSVCKVNLLIFLWQWEGPPFSLLRQTCDFGVDRKKAILDIGPRFRGNVAIWADLAHGNEADAYEHTVSSRWPAAVHVGAEVVRAWSRECRVCDTFRIKTKPYLLWVVLCHWKRSWDDFRLVSVSPSLLIVVRIVRTCRLQSLKVCKMKDLLRIGNKLALLEFRHDVTRSVKCKLDETFIVSLIQAYIELLHDRGPLA